MAIAVAAAITVGTAGLWGMTRLLESGMTYFPFREFEADPSAFGLRFEDVSFAAADGVWLHGWYCLPGAGRPHRADVVLFHGNAGNVSHRLPKIRQLAALGLGVFVFDYRGFGRSEGRPTDAGVLLDAQAAWLAFRDLRGAAHRPCGIYGESIGCLPAVRVASNPDAAFMILEGAFPAKRAVVAGMPMLWPFYPFVSSTLDMRGHVAGIRLPVLLLHARADEVIPIAQGRAVHRMLEAGGRAEFRELSRGGHNDCSERDDTFFPLVSDFLDRAALPGAAGGLPKR